MVSFYPRRVRSANGWFSSLRRDPDPTVTNFRIVFEQDYPPLTQWLRQRAQSVYQATAQNQANAQPGDQFNFSAQGVRLGIRYEKNGRPMEKVVVAELLIMSTIHRSVGLHTANWSVGNMRSVSGPAGTNFMSDPALATIAQSIQNTPQFNDEMARFHRANQARLGRRPATPSPSSTNTASSDSDILDIMHGGWVGREKIRDRGQTHQVNMVHERTTYVDPSTAGGTVDLSSHYRYGVTDGQGNFLMHNDANWNANTDPRWNQREWQTLTPEN